MRVRICHALNGAELSINQLAKGLPDVPKPSLYRPQNARCQRYPRYPDAARQWD